MKRMFLFCIFVLALGVQADEVQDSNAPDDSLQFEIHLDDPVKNPYLPDPEIKYTTQFKLRERSRVRLTWPENDWKQLPNWNRFSDSQKQLMLKYPTQIVVRGGNPYHLYNLYAVSESDLRLLVLGLLERYDLAVSQRLDDLKANQIEKEERLRTLDEKMLQLEQDREAQKQIALNVIASYKAKVPCVFGDNDTSAASQHASKNADEVSFHIREIEIELIGLNAKQAAIDAALGPKERESEIAEKFGITSVKSDLQLTLERSLVILETDRAAALARKSAYEQTFNQAKTVVDVVREYDRIRREIPECRRNQSEINKKLEVLKSKIEHPPLQMRPAEIERNKVIIQPVVH